MNIEVEKIEVSIPKEIADRLRSLNLARNGSFNNTVSFALSSGLDVLEGRSPVFSGHWHPGDDA